MLFFNGFHYTRINSSSHTLFNLDNAHQEDLGSGFKVSPDQLDLLPRPLLPPPCLLQLSASLPQLYRHLIAQLNIQGLGPALQCLEFGADT